MEKLYQALGGRKMTNGYLAAWLITVYAFTTDAGFLEYAGTILVALGITNGAVAMEDRKRLELQAAAEGQTP